MSYCPQYYVEYFFFSLLFEIPSIFHQKNEIIVSIIIVQRNKNVYFNDRN